MKKNHERYILSEIKHKQQLADRLRSVLFSVIDDKFQTSVVGCYLNGPVLTIQVNNQLIASQFRFQIKQLITQLKTYNEFRGLRKIDISLVFANGIGSLVTAEKTQHHQHSLKSVQMMEALSANIDDPELQYALKKLSRSLKKSTRSQN
jgi:hypothetical protein